MKKTIKEIAADLQVSASTVSIVLNSKAGVSDATRERVTQALTENGYSIKKEKEVVHSLPEQTRHIRFIYFRSSINWIAMRKDDFFIRIFNGIESGCKKYGFTFSIANAVKEDLADVLAQAITDRVDGILFLGTEYDASDFSYLNNYPLPFVCIDRPFTSVGMNVVCVDNYLGIRQAINHLKMLGHAKIHYLSTETPSGSILDRENSFLSILKNEHQKDIVFPLVHLGFWEDSIIPSFNTYLESLTAETMPTAFLTTNDVIAVTVTNLLKDKGFRIPDDVSIIGFDNSSVATLVSPALTTIHSPLESIGEFSVKRLYEILEGDSSVLQAKFSTKLIVRGTTAAPKNESGN